MTLFNLMILRDNAALNNVFIIHSGIMVASYPFGYLGDTLGRRHVILISLVGSTIFTFISVLMKNFTILLICRFCAGVL